MAARIKARFHVANFNKRMANADQKVAQVTLNAVTRQNTDDNVDWAKYSPAGKIELTVMEEAGGAYDSFEALLGKDVSITFDEIVADE